MRKPLQQNYFFKDRYAAVSPSWVKFGQTSYAVRSIMRLDFKNHQIPRPAKYSLFFFSLLLVAFSGVHVVNGSLPELLAKLLLGASLCVFACAFWLAFLRPVRYQIIITLFDGTHGVNKRYSLAQAQSLHEAITRAMDWHQGCSGGSQVPMIDTLASRRKTANARTWASTQR